MTRCDWSWPCEENGVVTFQMLTYCPYHANMVKDNRAELIRRFEAEEMRKRKFKSARYAATYVHGNSVKPNEKFL